MVSPLLLRNETMNLNDASNITLFRLYVEQGNKEAISIFFQNQTDLFYRVALKYTKNSADAEDVLQSSFVRMINKASQYKGLQSEDEKLLQTWCLSIVVNSALDRHRSESTRKKNESNYTTAKTKPFEEETNMETNSENEVVHKKVQDAIVQLPEKYRIPIHLKYVEGIELDAIATILKLNSNTLRSLIKRGLDKVSAQLKAENVSLSSVGLVGIISSIPLEKAPVGAKSLATKVFESANSSKRMIVKASPKTSLVSVKTFIILTAVCIASVVGFYQFNTPTLNPEPESMQVTKPISKTEQIIAKDTNETWLYLNEYQTKLTMLMHDFTWDAGYKCLVVPFDKPLMFSLPIQRQKKTFAIECEVAPFILKDGTHSELLLKGYWIRNNIMLGFKEFGIKDRYTFTKISINKQRIYFYENFVCVFINDKCYQINQYEQDLKDVIPAVMSKNFMFQKVSSKTYDNPPDELLKAISSISKLESKPHGNWFIDEKHINIDD